MDQNNPYHFVLELLVVICVPIDLEIFKGRLLLSPPPPLHFQLFLHHRLCNQKGHNEYLPRGPPLLKGRDREGRQV